MKSRITVEVDFDNGNLPIIQILSAHSDDVRDKLVSSFTQSLAHTSRWCVIKYDGHWEQWGQQNDVHKWVISPITPQQLPDELKLMRAVIHEKIGVAAVGYPKQGTRQSNRSDLWSPTEKAINDVMQQVEKLGASTKLTNAVIKLQEAQNLVYEHLEGIE